MTISPVITTGTPPLQITTGPGGPAYATILNLIDTQPFIVDEIYYRPISFSQFAKPLAYNDFEMNANAWGEMIATFTDPMDFLPVQYVQVKGRNMIFEGQAYLTLSLLPNEVVQLFFIGRQLNLNNALDHISLNNFKSVEGAMGKQGFFKDYTDEV